MRKFIFIALLASVAIPVAASAQERGHGEWRRSQGQESNSQSAPRAERRGFAESIGVAPRAERQPRAERAAPAADVSAQAQAATPAQGGGRNRGNWQSNRHAAPGAAPVAQQQAPVAQRIERSNGQRDWNRNDNGGNVNRNDNGRRDWNRDNNGYGNRSASRDNRNWDRGWRNNNRYNWQGYRSSNRYAYRLPRYYAPGGWNYGYRRFSIGATLFSGLFSQNYWIDDPWQYRLPPAYYPYQWVRYYNDALLVDTRSGYVVDSIPDIFWY